MSTLLTLVTKPSEGYALLDSGNGEKLEQYGKFTVARPDPQALWSKQLSPEVWEKANAMFVQGGKSGSWKKSEHLPDSWEIEIDDLHFRIKLSAFKHTGIFPEQRENWKWIREAVEKAGREVSVINLFGYTGGASLAAAKGGAKVCHVDGSKVSIEWAKENARLSGLESKPIRWMLDDAMAFVKREVRRGNKYDGIIMDPPTYGHGPKKELWQIEEHFPELIAECKKILSDKPLFVLINGYASGYSAIAYKNNVSELVGKHQGVIESGEVAIEEKESGRLLPSGIFARWKSI